MLSFQDILDLCGKDGGKILVVDERGEVRFVIVGAAEFSRLKTNESKNSSFLPLKIDTEKVNREIIEAQLSEDFPRSIAIGQQSEELAAFVETRTQSEPMALKSVLQNWQPKIQTQQLAHPPNLIEEAIDPSWDEDNPNTQG